MTKVPKATIIVHDGRFHTDDIFAVATINMLLKRRGIYDLEQPTIVRTRDLKQIEVAEYVMDVGGVYDPEQKRFDHHQFGGAGKRENGIPYASFGLVWKTYGMELAGTSETAKKIDVRLVQPIDANDNGVSIYNSKFESVGPYAVYDIVSALNPTWKEDEDERDAGFFKAVAAAEIILEREIAWARDVLEAEKRVSELYEQSFDKRICVFDKPYPGFALRNHPEVLYAVKPHVKMDGTWKVEAISVGEDGYEVRKPFPRSWAGKRDAELEMATGVKGSIFCHNARFLVTADSQEAAIKLAILAADNKE